MPRKNMANLVAKHGTELRVGFRHGNDPGVNTDFTTGERESVHGLGSVEHFNLPFLRSVRLVLGHGNDRVCDTLGKSRDFRIVTGGTLLLQLLKGLKAELIHLAVGHKDELLPAHG